MTETTPESTTTKTRTKKKKSKKTVSYGHVHILASFNNTVISITDQKGNLLVQSSAGSCGFRGSKKGTAYAAQIAAENAINSAKNNHNLSKADVFVSGVGLGRDSAVRALGFSSITVESISDETGIPHGGCRPRKARRV